MATSFSMGSGVQDAGARSFEQIIGNSSALEALLEQVKLVAPTQATVLVEGETGTGKEMIARTIHQLSPRWTRPFIKLNCAAIPLDLLESELFGHERGAFTGAIAQKIGRFEMADTGTLFLDEVGDIPPALQPKLLRVLQEQQFERLGSGRTHQVDVRLVAATNRNLAELVAQKQFRSDLYYRLNVFPVAMPPLRERQEDIPALVTHFVQIFSHKTGKEINEIPEETMAAFKSYPWPGNIRELQNLVERAVIRANTHVLPNPLPASLPLEVPGSAGPKTLQESERALIVQALDEVGWVVGGRNGAAAKLGVKRTTLLYKMKKFAIKAPLRRAPELGSAGAKPEPHIPVLPPISHEFE